MECVAKIIIITLIINIIIIIIIIINNYNKSDNMLFKALYLRSLSGF